MANEPEVLYRIERGVAWITLNRPDQLNAMTSSMDDALRDSVRRADRDRDCVVICVTGAGRGFCSGADLGVPTQMNRTAAYEPDPTTLEAFRFAYLRTARKPVVAAINGAAIGVGLVLSSFCDVRICASGARLGFTYTRVGLVAEYGLAWWLPRLIGEGASRDLLLSGRLVNAPEALRIGLVDQVADEAAFVSHVDAYLAAIVERCAPRSMATIKAQLNAAPEESLLKAIGSSHRALQLARSGDDFIEGKSAFLEKRPPHFSRLAERMEGDPS
ncbi:enoyl-CoA hydratase-related protein [Burkholderia sp. 22PA0099]|uniref:enoyl-CoA hydratase-related protein n=1 Tax=Burkholderia sp. 22PA0099 TaxID=3237372 RepID=UPI0039C14685